MGAGTATGRGAHNQAENHWRTKIKMKLFISLFLAGAAVAWTSPVTVSIVSIGNPPLVSQGVYVGPYTLSINGTNFAALCTDDKDWSYLNHPWQANETAVTSPNLGNTYNPGKRQEYEEAAYLYSLMIQPGADRIDIQHAAWDIMDDKITSVNPSDGAYSYIQNAVSNYSSMNLSGYEIISSTDKGNRQQEFIIDTISPAPEPASVGVFGAGLIIAAAISAWLRRHKRSRLDGVMR
jgi:hypothetical protein